MRQHLGTHFIRRSKQLGRPVAVRGASIYSINVNADRLEELKSAFPNQSTSAIIRDLIEDKLEWLSKKNPDGSDRSLPIGNVYAQHEDPKQMTMENYFMSPELFVKDCFSKIGDVKEVERLAARLQTQVRESGKYRRIEIQCHLN